MRAWTPRPPPPGPYAEQTGATAGARVVRYEAPGVLSSFTMFMGSTFYLGDVAQSRQGVPVQTDQTFRLDGLPAGSTELGLEVPLPLRNGPAILRKFEGVRLDAGEVLEEDFDLRPALPAVVAGRLKLEGDPMPIGRVSVRAGLADPDVVQAMAARFGFEGPEWCAVPEPDGSFRLLVPAGSLRLRAVDVVTGVEFGREEVKALAGQSTALQLRCSVAKARVRLDAPGQTVAERLVLQTGGQEEANQMSVMAFFGTWGGIGMPLSCGTREVDVFVPPGTVTLKVLSGAQRLASGNQHEEPAVLGELEFEAKVGEQPVLGVVLGAAPEVK